MGHIWDAEVVVTPELACALIESQFPTLGPATAVSLGSGWDNTAFEINHAYVFRFPRREVALLGFNAELAILPSLAPRMPTPIPNPEFIGKPVGDYPFPFMGYRKIKGRTACSVALDGQRAASAAALGKFLQSLHTIEAGEAAAMGAYADFQHKADPAHHIPKLPAYLRELEGLGIFEKPARFDWIFDGAEDLKHFRSTLVHGDLYVRHLVVDDNGLFCGVIDWGDNCYCDPAGDLCIAHTFLPPEAHTAFREAYGPIEDDTWRIAQFRALAYAATLLHFGHDTKDADLQREGLTILRYLEMVRN